MEIIQILMHDFTIYDKCRDQFLETIFKMARYRILSVLHKFR